uniref:Kinocilin n=1 Tax=Amphilophus citrinellus TaxID=61819 RepID=A0A3Q0SDV2_AMPCI
MDVKDYHGLRVGAALLSIVAGCIIIGVSRECDADAVGGIFLGAGGLGLLIAIYPFIKAWLNINHILPSFGKWFDIYFYAVIYKCVHDNNKRHLLLKFLNLSANFRVHPTPANPASDQPAETLRREGG